MLIAAVTARLYNGVVDAVKFRRNSSDLNDIVVDKMPSMRNGSEWQLLSE